MKAFQKIVLAIFVFFIVAPSFAQGTFKKITLEDLWKKRTFMAASVDGLVSMNDGENYTVLDENKIVKYSYKTGEKVETLLSGAEIGVAAFYEYEFSADESKVLLTAEMNFIYRHSFTANYQVYDFKTKTVTPVAKDKKQQLATFSPDGLKVAFVSENNLFIKDLTSGEEIQITKDGKYNEVINGAPDWVYEEEFSFSKAFEWSPNGENLSFIRFDESKVRMFNMTMFGGMSPKMESNVLYPENKTFKYPKAGEDNSVVTVMNYNLKSKTTVKYDIGVETDIYIPRIRWTGDANKLCIVRLNRLQNKLELLFANPADGSTKVVFTEENKYFISEDTYENLSFLEGNQYFLLMSEKDGFSHLYLYDLNGKLVRQITKGNFDVSSFLGFDAKNKLFYYISGEESPIRRDVYCIDIEGKKKVKLSTMTGTNNAEFSKGFKYFINSFNSATTPPYITLNDAKGKQIRVLEDNKALKELVASYGGVRKEFFKFKTSENVELNASIIKPNDFDANKKYPVLITQYSGPNSQEVKDRWSFDWDDMLAQQGIIVVSVDPRGTGARGEEFRKLTYLNLGKYETMDLIETAKYLGTQPYIDAARIGVWGWSYGGYMACSCLTKGADNFKLGVAVAPVTNWRYYDNIYTERYMRTPKENGSGYDENSPINHVKKFKGKLLIIHGSADDNVHAQNTMEFTEAMIQANKQFDMMIYNNRNHGIYGGNTRLHLYNKMTDYILKNL